MRRRDFLLGAVGAAAAGVTGCTPDAGPHEGSDGTCRTPEALVDVATIAGAPLIYEPSRARQSFRCDPRFLPLLEAWAADWTAHAGLGPITAISTYGLHVDKCSSWHQAGRAFDVAVVKHERGEVSCRYDVWGDDRRRLALYWRLAASLSAHFTYALAYPFNALHHNHIHVDNGVSGYGPTRFDEGSRAQTQVLQGVARYVFGLDCPQDGAFSSATRDAVRTIQGGAKIKIPLREPEGWRAFLTAAASHRR